MVCVSGRGLGRAAGTVKAKAEKTGTVLVEVQKVLGQRTASLWPPAFVLTGPSQLPVCLLDCHWSLTWKSPPPPFLCHTHTHIFPQIFIGHQCVIYYLFDVFFSTLYMWGLELSIHTVNN